MYEFAKAAGVEVAYQLRKMGTRKESQRAVPVRDDAEAGAQGRPEHAGAADQKQAEAMPRLSAVAQPSERRRPRLIGEAREGPDETGDQLGIFGPLIVRFAKSRRHQRKLAKSRTNMSEEFFARWMRANGAAMDASGLVMYSSVPASAG